MSELCLLGDWNRPEIKALTARLPQEFSGGRWHSAESIASLLRRSLPLDLILAVQWTPYEFLPAEVDRLCERFPLTRIVCGLSPWCAADRRSRPTWPTASGVFLSELPGRLRFEAAVLRGAFEPISPLAGSEERALADAVWQQQEAASINKRTPNGRTVGVLSADRAFAAMVVALLRQVGIVARAFSPVAALDAEQGRDETVIAISAAPPLHRCDVLVIDEACDEGLFERVQNLGHVERIIRLGSWLEAGDVFLKTVAGGRTVTLPKMAGQAELLQAILGR